MKISSEIRTTRHCGVAIFCLICSLSVLEGQSMVCSSSGEVSADCGALRVVADQVVPGKPYQAHAVTQFQQTIADGTHIEQSSTATIARDSEGRTMRSEALEGIHRWRSKSDAKAESSEIILTSIFDPIAEDHIDFTSDSSVAHVLPFAVPANSAPASSSISGIGIVSAGPTVIGMGLQPGAQQSGIAFAVNAFPMGSASQSGATTSSLGTKVIDGVLATGTRTTTIIPAGAIGNDRALVITQDTWYSSELKLVLESVSSDPRFGVTTYSVTDLQRVEPDPSLFQVPPGYTIQHVNGQAIVGSASGASAN